MQNRIWALEGVRNFRDFGGYATMDGRRVREGRLFRAADFSKTSAADITRLDALGVKMVLDLRRTHERTTFPSVWPSEGGARVVFYDPPGGTVAAPQRQSFNADTARNNMLATYRRIPTDPRFVSLYGDLLRALAEEGGPVIVHCAAGKDRTGVACAIVLAVLGVDRETIVADYELTNATVNLEERRALVRARLAPEVGRELSDDEIAPLIGVHVEYLHATLDTIDGLGGMEAYVSERLGIGADAQEKMREQLVV